MSYTKIKQKDIHKISVIFRSAKVITAMEKENLAVESIFCNLECVAKWVIPLWLKPTGHSGVETQLFRVTFGPNIDSPNAVINIRWVRLFPQ